MPFQRKPCRITFNMFSYQNISNPTPIIRSGDEVEFEIARGTNHARWDYHNLQNVNNDLGPSGMWAKGTVVDPSELDVSDKDHELWYWIKYEIEGYLGAGYAAFPKPANTASYRDYQWSRPGFLRKKHNPKCECGSEKIYGVNTSLHSFWCAKGVK